MKNYRCGGHRSYFLSSFFPCTQTPTLTCIKYLFLVTSLFYLSLECTSNAFTINYEDKEKTTSDPGAHPQGCWKIALGPHACAVDALRGRRSTVEEHCPSLPDLTAREQSKVGPPLSWLAFASLRAPRRAPVSVGDPGVQQHACSPCHLRD